MICSVNLGVYQEENDNVPTGTFLLNLTGIPRSSLVPTNVVLYETGCTVIPTKILPHTYVLGYKVLFGLAFSKRKIVR